MIKIRAEGTLVILNDHGGRWFIHLLVASTRGKAGVSSLQSSNIRNKIL